MGTNKEAIEHGRPHMPITERELRNRFGGNRIQFASAGAVRKPRKFNIYNVNTGEDLGTYAGRSVSEALDRMAQDFGFMDYNAVIADYGVSREDAIAELQITEVTP